MGSGGASVLVLLGKYADFLTTLLSAINLKLHASMCFLFLCKKGVLWRSDLIA